MMWKQFLDAPWVDETDMPARVRAMAHRNIIRYWQTRGWQLLLGEYILLFAAWFQNLPNLAGYWGLALLTSLFYGLGLWAKQPFAWLFSSVFLLMFHGMLMPGLGAVTALSYILPYTLSGLILSGRKRLWVQITSILMFWLSLLFEVIPNEIVRILPQLTPPRSILISYNILLAAFTFQSLRYLNQLAIDLNTTYVEDTVRQQSQQFLARVSHELRTPLNSVLGFAKMIKRRPDTLSDSQQMYLHHIIDEGEQLNKLVSDLLDSAHLSTGKLTLNKTACDVNQICQTLAQDYQPHVTAQVSLYLDLDPHLPAIQADPTRLRQVITNLLTNAIKYTQQGFIRIVTVYTNDQTIKIHIEDSGIGIPEDRQALIFVPFVQLDGQQMGVGLGLDIARQLIHLHGGELTVISAPQKGSTFTVMLPYQATIKPNNYNSTMP